MKTEIMDLFNTAYGTSSAVPMAIIGFVGMILSCVLLVVHLLTSANNKQLEFKIVITMILSSLLCLFGEYQMRNDSLKNIKEAIQDQYSDARIIEDQRYSSTFLTQGNEYSYSVKDSVITIYFENMAVSTIKDGVISDISDKNISKPDSDSEELDGRSDTTNLLLGIAALLSIIFTISNSTSIKLLAKKRAKNTELLE